MLPASFSAARAAGLPKYFTGNPCVRGHIAERRTSNQRCTECESLATAAWKAANPEKARQSNRKTKRRIYESLTPEQREAGNTLRRNWRARNREKVRAYTKKWYEANQEKAAQISREWVQRNPHLNVAKTNRRRAALLQAMPPWLTREHHDQIAAIYAQARRMADETGVPHDVDHIVPLKGKTVCGLHVPWNLRPLPASTNRRKATSLEN